MNFINTNINVEILINYFSTYMNFINLITFHIYKMNLYCFLLQINIAFSKIILHVEILISIVYFHVLY
ncbi:MAG: hypothetical protein K0Q97_939 [Bacillota bacterium]|jgi:hypothetical protein|nr:hypothetical protein [Bacillota bacterium]